MPDIQRGLFRLTRDVEVTNQTYTNLLNEAQLDIAGPAQSAAFLSMRRPWM
jgi:uncharacterized protein involved in exopolysaccharide biosynthesis